LVTNLNRIPLSKRIEGRGVRLPWITGALGGVLDGRKMSTVLGFMRRPLDLRERERVPAVVATNPSPTVETRSHLAICTAGGSGGKERRGRATQGGAREEAELR
jgi:hypothetical protein